MMTLGCAACSRNIFNRKDFKSKTSGRNDAEGPAPDVQYSVPPQDNAVLTEVLRVEPQLPRGPNDILKDYEAEMANITSQMSHELGAICEAMARVRSQGNRVSTWLGNDIRSRRCSFNCSAL